MNWAQLADEGKQHVFGGANGDSCVYCGERINHPLHAVYGWGPAASDLGSLARMPRPLFTIAVFEQPPDDPLEPPAPLEPNAVHHMMYEAAESAWSAVWAASGEAAEGRFTLGAVTADGAFEHGCGK